MSTSKLQVAVGELLDINFPECSIKENHRPDWLLSSNLTRLELDYYIDEIKTGFEIQGKQHYQYTPFFHRSYEEFELRKRYDQEKRDLCRGAGIKLIEIDTLLDAIIAISELVKPHSATQKHNGNHRAEKPKRKLSPKTSEDVVIKYMRDHSFLANNEKQISSPDEKIKEIKQFYKKARKKANLDRLMYFKFNYLSLKEQGALLEEVGILDKVYSLLPNVINNPSG